MLLGEPWHPLSATEINEYYAARPYIPFAGVFMRDALPARMRKQSAIVINLDDSGAAGTHWVGLMRGDNGGFYYYDSFGVAPPREVIDFVGAAPLHHNTYQYQKINSIKCGYFVVAMINKRMR